MRQSLLRSACRLALLAWVLFAGGVYAQNIEVGTLRQITAPCSGPIENYAIGYDGDTVETEEGPTLYGFNAQYIDRGSISIAYLDQSQGYIAAVLSKQSFGDCIECELRESQIATSYTAKDYSYSLYHREPID